MKKLTILAILGVICQGCTTTPKVVVPERASPVEAKINSLAEIVVKRTTRIQQLQEANYIAINGQAPKRPDLDLLPVLKQVKSLGKQYTGPLDTFIKRLSVVSSMNPPRFLNVKPTFDIIVTVDTDYKSVFSMLEQVGAVTGSRADVYYKAAENLIEVKYADY
ncbi:hypothetical protein HHX48_17575 [Salinimonas sp. HHU 13199]|uniref:Uncharacterized protein n=1 Tax=Salinimonas profundi TaxID=2729140 RepID=A0ABR8LMX7_9ALTE|nr:hypothetical protein [Salinimonas profundi]MBD3587552.1 hypothetical protein [Salinimonas profundi]